MVRIRTKREIDLIAESCQIVADTMEILSDYMKPGVSLNKLDKLAEDYICSRGARPAFKGYMGFPSTLCISIDDEVVHGIPSNRLLENGQIVGVDCGAEKNGYFGDHARTFSIGIINPEKQRLVDITRESLMLGIKEAKAGNYISDIGHAIQTHVEQNGFSVVRELVGHGIGTDLHEDPQIPNYGLPKQGYQLKEGMCLAIEPMVNMGTKEIMTDSDGWTVRTKDGKSSAHFEHTIAIQYGEAKILSTIQNNG
ncbi:MAG TPA: type I methionyl aminopeptidase [Candidatus Marinimicrobia bacterium]|jgi:methionyl aminopeptidase|nr:type I methionyl aminopeptidase [Candidatus Neomarinimicrobiota bacterium]MDP6261629.1 type I methionyl aminopeptidase [Candidatus Neomarinimicrobiota bacterium]MDP7127073.1 type I methionyl aminopeptidase [Candidatus Neomarinimicrobiota bacterium]MDP7337235.1 type I methionyl aminopeptidase [Candidatus Neomarinimicrobiota bacterium]MDP7475973.1 type I methionyl aminopeptidase [Candidatus Neomarinimicrobiota bacterium]|tara:strand:+ start:103 stop:861 length:759 start_codon:yes stop_codon:yes gene_type:complete